MLMNVKVWLEATGMKVAEERFLVPPTLPYIVFLEDRSVRGADKKNLLAERNINIELYSDKINEDAESKVESLLNEKSIEYLKDRTWVENERFFQTVYDFNLVEKI